MRKKTKAKKTLRAIKDTNSKKKCKSFHNIETLINNLNN